MGGEGYHMFVKEVEWGGAGRFAHNKLLLRPQLQRVPVVWATPTPFAVAGCLLPHHCLTIINAYRHLPALSMVLHPWFPQISSLLLSWHGRSWECSGLTWPTTRNENIWVLLNANDTRSLRDDGLFWTSASATCVYLVSNHTKRTTRLPQHSLRVRMGSEVWLELTLVPATCW